MSGDRPWRICDCRACEYGNANKAALRNAHVRKLQDMGTERLLVIARAAYASGDILGVAEREDLDPGVVSLALMRWKDVAMGEAIASDCIKVLPARKAQDDKMARRAVRNAEKTLRGRAKAERERIPKTKGPFA